MIGTALASSARPFWRLLEHYKIDPAYVFRQAGLDPAIMGTPRGRYSMEARVMAWKTAAERIDDQCLGLTIAEFWSPTDLHALGYAFLASATLRTGLQRISRYVKVINDVIAYDLGSERDDLVVNLRTQTKLLDPPPAPQEDSGWALITSLCRTAYGDELNPIAVRLRHREPNCPGGLLVVSRRDPQTTAKRLSP
jgi:hypothetical protein